MQKLPIWGKENQGIASSPNISKCQSAGKTHTLHSRKESLKLISLYTNVCVWWFPACQHLPARTSPHPSSNAAPTACQVLEPECNTDFHTALQYGASFAMCRVTVQAPAPGTTTAPAARLPSMGKSTRGVGLPAVPQPKMSFSQCRT